MTSKERNALEAALSDPRGTIILAQGCPYHDECSGYFLWVQSRDLPTLIYVCTDELENADPILFRRVYDVAEDPYKVRPCLPSLVGACGGVQNVHPILLCLACPFWKDNGDESGCKVPLAPHPKCPVDRAARLSENFFG